MSNRNDRNFSRQVEKNIRNNIERLVSLNIQYQTASEFTKEVIMRKSNELRVELDFLTSM